MLEESNHMTDTLVVLVVTLKDYCLSLQEVNSLSSSDVVVNTALMSVVMEDTQEEDSVPEVMLLVAEVVDSFAFSLLILLKAVKYFFVLVPEDPVVTKLVEPVEVKLVVKVVDLVETAVLKLLVVLEPQVYQDLNSKEVTVTQEDNKTLKPWTAEAVEPVTSVVKEVALTLEEAVEAQASVTPT